MQRINRLIDANNATNIVKCGGAPLRQRKTMNEIKRKL